MSTGIHFLEEKSWRDYELIDSGHFMKLERFGDQVLARPEPQAVWDPSLSEQEWKARATTWFRKDKTSPDRGEWLTGSRSKQEWSVQYPFQPKPLQFKLTLTAFKHVGLFPEQAINWHYIAGSCRLRTNPRVLNLFAYTGGASVAAKAAGADVTHVDAVKKVVSWGRENMEMSGLTDIRWVVEDAMLFVQREVKRQRTYEGIILDPPAYGRGPKGEKWVLEENLNELLKLCAQLIVNDGFVVLNLYSMGLSSLIAKNLLQTYFNHTAEAGELYVTDSFGKPLPLGTYARLDKLR